MQEATGVTTWEQPTCAAVDAAAPAEETPGAVGESSVSAVIVGLVSLMCVAGTGGDWNGSVVSVPGYYSWCV